MGYKLHEPIVGPKGCKDNAASVAVQSRPNRVTLYIEDGETLFRLGHIGMGASGKDSSMHSALR